MPTLPTLLLFAVAVLGLMVSPGPNMAMVISHGLSHGARGGIVSAAGIFVADLVVTLLVCAGVATLVAGSTQLAQLAAVISVQVERPGGHRVVVEVADQGQPTIRRVLPFRVVQPPGPPQPLLPAQP